MQAERDVYADFLDEAAAVLNLPALNGAASHYRAAGGAWEALLGALLPADAPMLGEAREHIDLKTSLFVEKGATELDRIIACNERIEALKDRGGNGLSLERSRDRRSARGNQTQGR